MLVKQARYLFTVDLKNLISPFESEKIELKIVTFTRPCRGENPIFFLEISEKKTEKIFF